ncbi:GTP-binding protein LepA [Arenibacter sp. GZD96]|uniref:hypothetical protein n=1 Tax=Aurantibrevibacter litoralis TaxID=3106030 RepID=UPI002AFFCD55|nr:hypothetical protein [Arenibacter sp. GZD-96]MEA1786583.1 GTP-binding protein LepA [Arenibacter sp. GZD-96]
MNTYIARFSATHNIVIVEQHSIFIWQQESGEVDIDMLKGKIARESAVHFFRLLIGDNYQISPQDIQVKILKTEAFRG